MCRADLPLTLSTAWQSIMLLQQRLRFASSMDGLDCLCRLADEPRPSTSDPATMKEASLSQRSGEDHAQGMAAMPPSSNAPNSLSMRRVTQQDSVGSASSSGSAHAGPGISEQEAGM